MVNNLKGDKMKLLNRLGVPTEAEVDHQLTMECRRYDIINERKDTTDTTRDEEWKQVARAERKMVGVLALKLIGLSD